MGKSYHGEAIVIGAGPAGLGTALGLAREGIGVTVLEKQEEPGTERRGETIRFHGKMDALLGGGFFSRQTIRKICRRTYFSHTGCRQVDRSISNPNLIISWPDFIQDMAGLVSAAGAKIWTAAEVVDLIRKDGQVFGVKAMVGGFGEEELAARAVFSCGGWGDPASRLLCIDRSGIDLPVSKKIVQGYQGPDDRLEYHFHVGPEALAVGTIFPRGGGEAEVILMSLPKKGRVSRLSFDDFCSGHPRFGDSMDGVKTVYTLNSFVPMGGMLYPFSPRPGLVMAGDALGHVQGRGGSGIRTSFLIGYEVGKLGALAIKSGKWTAETSAVFERTIRKSRHVRSLELHNLVYTRLRAALFGRIGTPEAMDRRWPILRMALR